MEKLDCLICGRGNQGGLCDCTDIEKYESSTERLERIKTNANYSGYLDDDIVFLIEQAEHAERLGKKTVELNEFLQGYYRPKDLGRDVVDVAMDMIREQVEIIDQMEMKYENTGAMFSRQNMLGQIERLKQESEEALNAIYSMDKALEFYSGMKSDVAMKSLADRIKQALEEAKR